MPNILFEKRVRKKRKAIFQTKPYYELDWISFKEKFYTLNYCLETTGFTTQGETEWMRRHVNMPIWDQCEKEFKEDYANWCATNQIK